MQRIDEKMRPHSLGVFGVYGDEPDLEQFGLVLWRGPEIPVPMIEHPQFEYWQKRKLDVTKEEDKQIILEYMTKNEGKVRGMTAQKVIWYK